MAAKTSVRRDLRALRNLINQADLVLATIPDPDSAVRSARESLTAALALSKDLIPRVENEDAINPQESPGYRQTVEE